MLFLVRKYLGVPSIYRARARARQFLGESHRAAEVQRDCLLSMISRNAESQFGRDHHFHEIRSAADFRRRVPVRGYSGHEPYIDRVRQGDLGALFGPGTQVLMFAMTSGTTATPKTIPITREALRNYRDAWLIWGIMAFDAHPEILERGLKPILQIASNWRESTTPSGIPCGAITGLTAKMQSILVRTTYCMPPSAAGIKDIEAKYYVALRLSVYRDLGTIIAANPATMLAIARLGDREKETLIRDLRDGTIDSRWEIPPEVRQAMRLHTRWKRRASARRLEEIVERTGRLLPRDYWPDLSFLANWTGGVMGAYLRQFPEYFGDRPIRDPGLIASEGRFTIPIEDNTPAGILDIKRHYFEFIPEGQEGLEQPETVEAHELIEGRHYYILPTTASGLYRYQIHDLIRCVGFHGQAPVIEFLNKGTHFSSLTGEKISEFQVVRAVHAIQTELGIPLKSFLLAPRWGQPPHYVLLIEDDDLPGGEEQENRLAAGIERNLARLNVEYENKRQTLRLDPIRIQRIKPGSWSEFQRRRLAKSGGTVEQYKQPCLVGDLDTLATFQTIAPLATGVSGNGKP